jgi:cytochrome c oxidase subunit I
MTSASTSDVRAPGVARDSAYTGVTPARERALVATYMGITALVLALLMVFGLLMKASQAGVITIPANRFYQLLTAHGIGMVAISGLGGAGVMWFFLSRYVSLSRSILLVNLVCFLIGVVLVLGGIFIGGFAAAWTFLFPLPAHSQGIWSAGATASYLVGVLVVGVGFLLLFLDTGRAIISKYGSLGRALGWPQAFGNSTDAAPPPAVVASTVVAIINIPAIAVGAVILTMSLVNAYAPGFQVNALLAKNLIYFFGHVFINSTIYMGVIGVYEILPTFTGRPWKSSKPFLLAWTATMLMVLTVYPHHLFMDYANPRWAAVLGQILSYTSSLPVLAVTAAATLANVYRSGMKWNMTAGLLFASIMGWSVGVVPAVVDGTIAINRVMHNTLWVPGHFHTYLLLGVVAMLFGFMYFLGLSTGTAESVLDRTGFWMYVVGSLAFASAFLAAGALSVPRRWAVHLDPWLAVDRWGAVFALVVVAGATVFVTSFLRRVRAISA